MNRIDIKTTVMHGDSIQHIVPPCHSSEAHNHPKIKVDGEEKSSGHGKQITISGKFSDEPHKFEVANETLSKHMMFIGGTGCGKTELFSHFVHQLRSSMDNDDVMIIFDTKGDFKREFYESGDLILGNSPQYSEVSEKWNIFKEIKIDGWDDKLIIPNTQELCKALFSELLKNKNNNPFFPNAACAVLAAIIICHMRYGRKLDEAGELNEIVENKLKFTNAYLKGILDGCSAQEISEALEAHPDLTSVKQYIDGSGEQAQGVLSTMYTVTRDIFTGVFADDGGFSMRELVRNRGRKVLFIEYDLAMGSVLGPIYSALFDLALREALSQKKDETDGKRKGNVYLIIDELKLLPNLTHLDDGINFGRSLGVKVIVGLQNIQQLEEAYSKERANNIIYGFSSVVAFRSNDPQTREYARNLFGRNVVLEGYRGSDGILKDDKRDGYVVEDWDLSSLRVGEAVVGLVDQKPFRFRFDRYYKDT